MSNYTGESIRVLSPAEHVRLRPGMYFGSNGPRAIEHMVYECVANSIDQYLVGECTFVKIKIEDTLITIEDDGPGLPFDKDNLDDELSNGELYLSSIHKTPTRDNHFPHVHIASYGIGLAPVNFVSKSFQIQSWRNNCLWEQRYEKGEAVYRASILFIYEVKHYCCVRTNIKVSKYDCFGVIYLIF